MPPSAIEVRFRIAVPVLVTVTVCDVDTLPGAVAANVSVLALSFTASAAAPVPVSDTVCGEPLALSVTLSVPASAAAEPGWNATNSEHEAPAAREVPQFPISRNDALLVPPSAMELMVSAVVPVLVTFTVVALLVAATTVAGKAIDAGVIVTVDVDAVPVPLRPTVCGDPVALSAIDSEALRAPVAAGLNSTDTVQLAPAASEAAHVFAEIRNEPGFVPVSVSEVSVTAVVPVFFTVTICAAVVELTGVEAKVSDGGVTETVRPVAVPPVYVKSTDVQKPPTCDHTRT